MLVKLIIILWSPEVVFWNEGEGFEYLSTRPSWSLHPSYQFLFKLPSSCFSSPPFVQSSEDPSPYINGY